MNTYKSILLVFMLGISLAGCSQQATKLQNAASRMEKYLPLVQDKNVALVANPSSLLGNTHLADTLLALGVNVVKVFGPEHGFRGGADAGEHVHDGSDIKSGLPIISLYGKNRKPSPGSLMDVDIILFDLQDVGARFYTYIYTLAYVMEAAAESGIPLIVLDRPNPNGFYIDGPVMEEEHTSFVGLHPGVPVVYGMTIGEYGRMVNGEGWLADGLHCRLTVIPMENYNRNSIHELPVRPSPNLPDWQSVYLYPSLCLFEGTVVSVGRGTDRPFSVYGHPAFHLGSFVFTPESRPGAQHPKLEGKTCYGQNLRGYAENHHEVEDHFNLAWLIGAYKVLDMDSAFFTPYFEKLAGTSSLRKQIMQGMDEAEIRAGWQPALDKFKMIRKKYLLYKDFD